VEEIAGGWDSRASIVDGVWLDREPLRSEIRPKLLTETRLLPWLAPQLPLPVPLPQVVQDEPLRVRHRLLPGTPATHLTCDQGAALGGFFRALQSVDATAAVATGVPTHDAARGEHLQHLDRFRREVLPRVPGPLQGPAESLLERLSQPSPAPVLVHGDVGSGHVLLAGGTVSGVIDWSDAHIGDPALDLAWLIHGSSAGQSVATAYDADAALVQRAHDWHLLGPWHEVLYGLDIAGPAYVESGMTGILARLT
jgi:aminoglycoside phosphotransferase (APT) family kinase protein